MSVDANAVTTEATAQLPRELLCRIARFHEDQRLAVLDTSHVFAVWYEHDDYSYSDWEFLGVFARERDARQTAAEYAAAKDTAGGEIFIERVGVNEPHWRSVRQREAEEAAQYHREQEERRGAEVARRVAETAMQRALARLEFEEALERARLTVPAAFAFLNTIGDIQVATQFLQDHEACLRHGSDEFWNAKAAATGRRVRSAFNRFKHRIDLEGYRQVFEAALGPLPPPADEDGAAGPSANFLF